MPSARSPSHELPTPISTARSPQNSTVPASAPPPRSSTPAVPAIDATSAPSQAAPPTHQTGSASALLRCPRSTPQNSPSKSYPPKNPLASRTGLAALANCSSAPVRTSACPFAPNRTRTNTIDLPRTPNDTASPASSHLGRPLPFLLWKRGLGRGGHSRFVPASDTQTQSHSACALLRSIAGTSPHPPDSPQSREMKSPNPNPPTPPKSPPSNPPIASQTPPSTAFRTASRGTAATPSAPQTPTPPPAPKSESSETSPPAQ